MKWKEKAAKNLTHPWFMGLLISLVLYIVVKPDIHKYRVQVTDTLPHHSVNDIHFFDLDNDGTSEFINVDRSAPDFMKIMVMKDNMLVDQYNLRSGYINSNYVIDGDYNEDGYQELYLLTRRKDSLFVSILDPLHRKDFMVYERLFYSNDTITYSVDSPESIMHCFHNFNDGNGKSLIFALCSGYSKQPRKAFKYELQNDTVLASPSSGAAIYSGSVQDVNNDSVAELIIQTTATGNYSTYVPYSDGSSWLMVLDHKLDFLFEPVEFKGYPSYLRTVPLKEEQEDRLVVLHGYYGMDSIRSAVYIYSLLGERLDSLILENRTNAQYFINTFQEKNKSRITLLNAYSNTVLIYDKNFEVLDRFSVPGLYNGSPICQIDLDADGLMEFVFPGPRVGSIVITRNNFSEPLEVQFDSEHYPYYMEPVYRYGKRFTYANANNAGFIFSYARNPFFIFRYAFFLTGYALISLFIYLIFRIQRVRARRQLETTRKISRLQILTLKNQIDPHFTFNILNSIGLLYTKSENKEKAYNIFVKYSRLLKQAVQNSDQISVTLSDELDFVKNYIELEQFRLQKSFEYSIDCPEDVDLGIRIPRMLIHSFVENAIKHGIQMTTHQGELQLRISRDEKGLKISITDNGPGLDQHTNKQFFSTGKGLKIIDDLIEQFNTLEGKAISYTIRSRSELQEGEPGTQVQVIIPKRIQKRY